MAMSQAEKHARWYNSAKGKAWMAKNRKTMTEIDRKCRLDNPVSYFHTRLKAKARRQGLKYELTKAYMCKLLAPMRCSVTGVELEHTLERRPNAPSIDRIDSSKGYVKGNVRLVSWMYNRAKGDGTDEDVLIYLIDPLSRRL